MKSDGRKTYQPNDRRRAGDVAYAGTFNKFNPESHAMTPVEAAMIRKTQP